MNIIYMYISNGVKRGMTTAKPMINSELADACKPVGRIKHTNVVSIINNIKGAMVPVIREYVYYD